MAVGNWQSAGKTLKKVLSAEFSVLGADCLLPTFGVQVLSENGIVGSWQWAVGKKESAEKDSAEC